jgi:hypothetical protein
MRRLMALALAFVVAGSLLGSAGAGTPRVRTDPNDSGSNLDIRSVTSDLSTSTVYLKIAAWQRIRYYRFNEEYVIWMDTFGEPGYDRVVEVLLSRVHGRATLVCLVEDASSFELYGSRPALRPNRWSVACELPRAWFGHIDRAVRFYVVLGNPGSRPADRAPDRGVYVWL